MFQNATRERGLELLHAAATACPHGIMVEDAGRVAYANDAYARLAGFPSPERLSGALLTTLVVPSDAAKRAGRQARLFDTLRFEFRHDGRPFHLHVVRDITDRRTLESRLLESEKMEALGRLVGGVAHDFNNILTAITLHAELLREKTLGHGGREIAEIREAAQRGADLVRQLLTFARQQPSAPQVMSIRRIISSMNAVIEPLIGEDIDLSTRFATAHDCVSADPSQIQQVVLNLVMNARDAMPKGGRIRIHTADHEVDARDGARRGIPPGSYVSIVVEDNGRGMTEEVRARIFEPFFTTKKHGSGTGLGMSTVYGIVAQARGAVAVASRPGKGTRVTVLLPRELGVDSASIDAEHRPLRGGSETVLLAEDDDAVRSSIAELLATRGYRVLEARDGVEAIRIARTQKHPIDLMLSDVVMPRMSGVDAAAVVRRLHTETKVLFISGYPAKAGAEATVSGALLLKPFSRSVLAQRVREALEQRLPASGGARGRMAARGTP